MRNKFSELIDAGVAEFKYVNTVTDTTDPICREYNNLYAMYTDTHMNPFNGGYIITGNIKAPEYDKQYYPTSFDRVLSTCQVGMSRGYHSILHFFATHNLTGYHQKVNGDDAYVLTNVADFNKYHICSPEEIEQGIQDEPGNLGCPGCYYECGSNISHPISELTSSVTYDPVKFYECFNVDSLNEAVEKLNNSSYIKGNYFQYNNTIYGYINGRNIKL